MYPIDELIGKFKYELNNYQDLEKKIESIFVIKSRNISIPQLLHVIFLWNIKNKFK